MMNSKGLSLQNFTMLSVIGKGSYAKVILVRKKDENDKVYAMKILKKKYIEKRKQEDNVMIQKQILTRLKHPFLVRLDYSFQNNQKLFFVLEYCPGGQLFALLSKKHRLSQQQTKFYAAQIILAIEYLHNKNVIYRDLKPQNILIDKKGFIRLTDFGLSKINITQQNTFSVCGTPQYLAPEVIYKQGHGKPVDWWCLGSVIYQMIVGLPPFYSKKRTQLFDKIKFSNPNIPPYVSLKLRNLLEQLFQKNPQHRLGSKGGAEQVKKHTWFQTVNWNQILKKNVKAPFIPIIKSQVDVSNFDRQFTQCEIQSMGQNSPKSQKGKNYSGFSWNKSNEQNMEIQEQGKFEIQIQTIPKYIE